ncbi:MAG TPA: hypothetical protein VGC11_16415 [Acidimicrobiia bacterium]|jgi:hypothetical protein
MSRLETLTRPTTGTDHRAATRHRPIGFALAALGLLAAVVTLIANVSAAGQVGDGNAAGAAETLAWSFGLTVTAFGTAKLAIAVVLVGILVRLWQRVEAVKSALPDLKAPVAVSIAGGPISTPFGPAVAGRDVPRPLRIHTMAKALWAPMLVMGYMAVLVGLVVSFVWASDPASVDAAAWTQGLQFLGEGFLLAGISFLLGTILASLREGGGEVQAALGLTVETLKMPTTAKVFIGLMALGVMVAMTQFVLYLVVAAGVSNPTAWFTWLGPLREFGLGVILAGIVMALVTIGNVLDFQFHRVREIVTTGN